MSTTVELGKATAEIARLRASIERLADHWEAEAASFPGNYAELIRVQAGLVRRLLDES